MNLKLKEDQRWHLRVKILDGKRIAAQVRSEVADGVVTIQSEHGLVPGLVAVLVGDDPASSVYVRSKEKAAAEAGIKGRVIKLPAATKEGELLKLIETLNLDETFHGILVQLPLPSEINEDRVIESISPAKDVDGLHPVNMGLLMAGRPRFVPATPYGIQEILMRSGINTDGKHVVVCGRSNIVGKPVANLLMQRQPGANATVSVCHTRTENLSVLTKQADILIAAIGRPRAITSDMVQEGVVVIDVGINRVDDPVRKRGYRLDGDVDFGPVSEKASAITPVPGGVGPMTIAMLLQNTLKAALFTV